MSATTARHETYRDVSIPAVNWVAEYLETVASRPVAAQVEPGEILARLPATPPRVGEPVERIIESLSRDLLPGITHWNHPRFFAYVPQSAPPAAIVADTIVAALNVNGLLWETSPTLTELERAVLGWLAQMLGLPATWFGQIQESASSATLTALTVARERGRRTDGGQSGAVVCSSEAHASVHKAAKLLDLPLVTTDADSAGRMSVAHLERALRERDVSAVVATVGTTSSAAVDPIRPIAELCQQRGSWLHVDGAYAAAAAICPEHADLLSGIEMADSFVINAHKGFGLTAGCSCLYTPHEADLHATFATTPAYLLDKDDGLVNLVDYGPMFSRRLAALKLWFAIRSMGVDGLREAIRHVMALAGDLARLIDADAAWELCAQSFGVLCFRLRASDQANYRLLREVNRDGRIFISRTRVDGRLVLRLAIGNYMTRRDDVLLAWDVLREHAQLCQAMHSGVADSFSGSCQG